MKVRKSASLPCLMLFGILTASQAFAAPPFSETELLWQAERTRTGYSLYAETFAQDILSMNLDTKNGCYRLGQGDLVLDLVINKAGVVDSVTTEKNDARAECFRKIYTGLQMNTPPFSPLVIHMILPDRFN